MSPKLDVEEIRKVAKNIRMREVTHSTTFSLTVALLVVSFAAALFVILLPQWISLRSLGEAVTFFAGVAGGFLTEKTAEYYSDIRQYGVKIPEAVEKVISEAGLERSKLERCRQEINICKVPLQENEDESLSNILGTLQKIIDDP
jgi:hypothetical protein